MNNLKSRILLCALAAFPAIGYFMEGSGVDRWVLSLAAFIAIGMLLWLTGDRDDDHMLARERSEDDLAQTTQRLTDLTLACVRASLRCDEALGRKVKQTGDGLPDLPESTAVFPEALYDWYRDVELAHRIPTYQRRHQDPDLIQLFYWASTVQGRLTTILGELAQEHTRRSVRIAAGLQP